ncbi:TPA: hypothetical protein DDW69_05000 [candidate division CPR2 bacterium]|uniref:Phytoene synthase n=1 Tax=candidate division CPR2 bacterium GW2011_GWC1_41_48 TaxID=1618344 RepID=A0A0G0W8S4_UNCC2|nr:MAG: hypothetical protein UT47_C0002G0122 [candidate division CPR2 bacterium GW2011_GWC2_39_35]KKR27693.1 MAG: hypothetical protein UT60_C0040G0015 [candidate division CPR2 bacterium GW2011_GWD2_39_7]KKR28686.1 MAG: hypothetical protein UT59_C0021G0007 [candidate division CPR2 bacterium GW2011_GWD1_39_7]KKS09404.1 MAG: hypothetical protein UU65_C0002G0182 [candidate division CPR2 bacterium GW2011_GWC1_41_48]OGB61346.1 MAG: hypothetical protein A2Y27_01000 [candidate division CPR2 bacterium G
MQIDYGKFPYSYPISTAKKKCKERYVGFRFLTKVPKIIFPNKDIYALSYAYFRWFDDIVDSIKLGKEDVGYIIKRQKDFLNELYLKGFPEEIATEELFLAHFVRFDQLEKRRLKTHIVELVKTLEFDFDRRGRVISAQELESYINSNVSSYIAISLSIFDLPRRFKESFYQISYAAFVIDYIYDLRSDIRLGFINIPEEEIEEFKLNPASLDSEEAKNWIKCKINSIEKNFYKPLPKGLPILPYIMIRLMILKRKFKLKQIKGHVLT